MSANFQQLANFIWSVADLLRGPYRPPQYERVMLQLTVLCRFDAVLAPSKEAVLKRHEELKAKNIPNIDAILNNLAKDEDGTCRAVRRARNAAPSSCQRRLPLLRSSAGRDGLLEAS